MTDNTQDYSQIDSQKYYLEQFQRWQKMSTDPQVGKEQPELYDALQTMDWDNNIAYLQALIDLHECSELKKARRDGRSRNYNSYKAISNGEEKIFIEFRNKNKLFVRARNYIRICQLDVSTKQVNFYGVYRFFTNGNMDNYKYHIDLGKDIFIQSNIFNYNDFDINRINFLGSKIIIKKPIVNGPLQIDECIGILEIHSLYDYKQSFSENLNVVLTNFHYHFNKLTIVNTDLSMWYNDNRNHLLQLHSEGKLELINCNFPELDTLRLEQENLVLKNELESTKDTQPQEIFDLTDVIPREYWEPFTTYFSGFKSFVRQAKGRDIGIELNVNNYFLFKLFSDNQEDLAYAESDLNDFLMAINYYSQNKYQSLDKLQSGHNIELAHMMMENRVNQLIQEIKYLELENRTLRKANNITSIIQVLQDGIIQQLNSNQLLLTNHQPTIYTEGKIDVDYLIAAIRVLGFKKLEGVKIESIGKEDIKGDNGGGQSSLDSYYKANRNKTDQFGAKIILLYDCDTKVINSNQDDKLYCYKIPLNPSNQQYPLGIENLLPDSYFLDSKYWKTTTKESNGKRTTIEELDKIKLCQDICNQAKLEDFENFGELLITLEQLFFS